MALPRPHPEPCQTRRPLFEALGVSGIDFRCRVHPEGPGPEEPNATHSIVFLRRGLFQLEHRGATLVADSNQVLFFHQGEPYRYAHPLAGGDDCTVLILEPEVARQAVARFSPRDGERSDAASRPFRRTHALCVPRLARLHYRLLARETEGGEALDLEDRVAELVEEAVGAGYETEGGPVPASRRQRDRVEEAKLALHARLDAPPSLAEMAAALDCSPFHLSRTFHAVTGLRLRQYLTRLRAALAAHHLRAGARDLTALALDLGFSDHAHFTHAFRAEWGMSPSALRGWFGGREEEAGERQGSGAGALD